MTAQTVCCVKKKNGFKTQECLLKFEGEKKIYVPISFLKTIWEFSLNVSEHGRSGMPEVDLANLCSVKLVMLNVIITHVKRNYHPALDADTVCHDSIACGRFIFLVITEGMDQL